MVTRQHSRFVHFVLPWLVTAGAFVLFFVTRHPWMSGGSLPVIAKVTGWDWLPGQLGPAVWLVTAPVRLLPAGAQPTALNLLAALCGALSLGLLAKAVALLPHDRTREQRQREKSDFNFLSTPLAWAPPVAAALFAGLQITWWEHATSFTGEMVNLLIFAFCVFAILRFRVATDATADRWLLAVAFLAPLAAVGNWGMTGFLPLFLVAAIWVKGIPFFEGRFLTRGMLCAAAGFAFILFNPLLQKLHGNPASLFQLLRIDLGMQKSVFAGFPKYLLLIFGLTSLLPALVMGLRWPSTFGDLSAAGAAVTNLLFKVIHAAFLAACVAVAFDPPFSPRAHRLLLGLPAAGAGRALAEPHGPRVGRRGGGGPGRRLGARPRAAGRGARAGLPEPPRAAGAELDPAAGPGRTARRQPARRGRGRAERRSRAAAPRHGGPRGTARCRRRHVSRHAVPAVPCLPDPPGPAARGALAGVRARAAERARAGPRAGAAGGRAEPVQPRLLPAPELRLLLRGLPRHARRRGL
ncbi:MAG TPA: DUF2723 domain-containing protein [Verrucomicrobiota bacterium]|nr:DUF2723 domain-containing protein [Verrucomicrobiota bacterium]